jgi:transcriptional regulator with XRE-family HTH domain
MEIRSAVAERINALRIAKGWTQRQLAKESGIGEGRISVILQGSENLNLDTIAAIERAFKTPVIEISSVLIEPDSTSGG